MSNDTQQPLDILQQLKPKSPQESAVQAMAVSPSSSDILANLQRRATELNSPWRAFQGNLDEMVARTAYRPESGVAMLGEKRAKEAQELQNIGMMLSQTDLLKQQLAEGNTALSPGREMMSGAMGNAAPTAQGAQGTAVGERMVPYRGVMIPERVFRVIELFYKAGNKTEADKEFAKYVNEETKFATNPGSYKQDDFWNAGKGQMDRTMPIQNRGMVNAPVAPQVNAPQVNAPQVNAPAMTPPSAGFGSNVQPTTQADTRDIYRFENLGNESRQRLNDYAKTQLGLQGDVMNRPDASELFNRMPLDQRKNAFLKAGETPVVSNTAQPTSAPTQMSATAPTTAAPVKSYSDYLTEQAGKKSFSERAGAKAGEETGNRQAKFESSAVDANKNLQTAGVALNILDTMPEAIGLSYKNKALGATIEAGKLFGKDIEPFVRRATLSPEAVIAGDKFDSLAEQNSLRFRQDVFKGTGPISDFETKLAERAAGMARDKSVEANRFFFTLALESYRALDKLGTAWQQYQKANPGSDFSQFEQSSAWKSITAERDARLKTHFSELDYGNVGFGSKVPSKGANQNEIESWKQRYGKPKGQ